MTGFLEFLVPSGLHVFWASILWLAVLLRRRKEQGFRRRRAFIALGLIVWSWCFSAPVVENALRAGLETRYPVLDYEARKLKNPVIVVLASGYDYDPASRSEWQLDEASIHRTIAGFRLWRGVGGSVTFVGYGGPHSDLPVADRMAAFAMSLGVPASRIRTEIESLNTRQNLENLRSHVVFGGPFYLVTSAVHMPRAMETARKLGLNPVAVPCDFRSKRSLGWRGWFPSGGTFHQMLETLHEIVGLWYYRLRGWT